MESVVRYLMSVRCQYTGTCKVSNLPKAMKEQFEQWAMDPESKILGLMTDKPPYLYVEGSKEVDEEDKIEKVFYLVYTKESDIELHKFENQNHRPIYRTEQGLSSTARTTGSSIRMTSTSRSSSS